MIRIVDIRLVVEKPTTHDKFYPRVISATAQMSYPFSISAATINVVSNLPPNTSGYAAPIAFNDIIRLQVSIKVHRTDHTVWQDLFHGRVEKMTSTHGKSNPLKLYCVGHEAELSRDLVEETKTYTEATDAKTLLSYFSKYFTSSLTYSAANVATGVSFPTYDTTLDQTYLDNLVNDMEKQSGYDWIFSVVPVYDSNNMFDYAYTRWQPFTTTATESYKVIEGTQRLISASFEVAGDAVSTTLKVYGATPAEGAQFKGYYTDATLEALYGKRSLVETYSWVGSNSLCTTIAQGLQQGSGIPVVSGQVVVTGVPQAKLGDLVYVKIPSIELNKSPINGYYYVYRIQHDISKGTFNTTLDLGKVQKTAEDYIAAVSKSVKIIKCSLVKK